MYYDVSSDDQRAADAEMTARLALPDYSKLKSPLNLATRRERLLGEGGDTGGPSAGASASHHGGHH